MPALSFEKICVQTKLNLWLCNVSMSHDYLLPLFRAITSDRIVVHFRDRTKNSTLILWPETSWDDTDIQF